MTNKKYVFEFVESRRLCNRDSRGPPLVLRAGNIMNGYDSVLLETSSVWRGEGPEMTVSKSTRFHELENIYFVDYIVLSIKPLK